MKHQHTHRSTQQRITAFQLLALSVLLFSAPPSIHADPLSHIPLTPILLSQPDNISLSQFSAYLKDEGGNQTLAQVTSSSNWVKSQKQNLNFGFSDSAYWLAAHIHSPHTSSKWFIRIRYSLFDDIQIYVCPKGFSHSANDCQKKNMGDHLPFDQRDVAHPEFVFEIPLHSKQSATLFIRTQTQGSYPLMIQVEDEHTLTDNLIINSAIRGGYITMMMVMGLYNLFLFFSTRSLSYLYYSGFVISFMMFHATYAGSAFQFLWPNNPEVNGFALPLIFSINIITLTLFVPKFLNLHIHGKKSFYLFRIYLVSALILLISNAFAPYQTIMKLLNLFMMIISVSALIISARFWLMGIVAARFFTIAWFAFIIGLVLAAARSFGAIPLTPITLNGYQIGSFIEIILLSLALGERITQLQKEKIENKKALFDSQEQAINNLKRYEDLYQNSLTGQFQLNEAKLFIKSNPAWLSIIGADEQTIDSHTLSFDTCFQHPEDAKQFWALLENEEEIKGSTLELTTLNSHKPIYVNISMRRGQDSAWIASAQDISEEFEHEQTIKQLQSEKNRSLRQLVMGVSHEMNTPLGNIKMAQTFLEDHVPKLDSESRAIFTDGLDIVKQGSDRLQELGQLMKSSVASNQTYHQEVIQIHNWFEQWANNQIETTKLKQLQVQTGRNLNHWNTYPEALEKIFNQLIKNSITHNPKQYDGETLCININLTLENKKLIIEYIDNGSGIAQEDRDNVFQPFYTTQRQQATEKGLGLYHTYNLITDVLNGYVIWPEDHMGFQLTLAFPIST